MARAGGLDRLDQHRPALFGREAADAEQQRGAFGQLAHRQQAAAQVFIAQARRKHARIDAHRVGHHVAQTAFDQPRGQPGLALTTMSYFPSSRRRCRQ
jgi:hypothetical protein